MNTSNLLRFVGGRFVAFVGDQFLLFAVPLIVYKATGSVSKSGLAFFLEWMPRVLSLPIAGVLADRFGGTRVYMASDLARTLTLLATFALLVAFPSQKYLVLSLVVGVMALLNAQAFVAVESSLPSFVTLEEVPRAQAILQGAQQTSQIVGPALAGTCAAFVRDETLLLLAALAFGISFVNVVSMRAELAKVAQPKTVAGVTESLRQGFRVLVQHPVLFVMNAFALLVNVMIGVTVASSAALTTGTFHEPETWFGVLFTVGGAAGVLTFFLVPRLTKAFSILHIGVASYAAMCVGGLVVGVAPSYAVFAVGLSLLLGCVGLFNVYLRTERVRIIPREHFGKTVGLVILLNQLSLPFSGLIVAAFADALGAQRVILGVTSIAIACALGLAIVLPLHRRRVRATSRLA